MINGVTLVAMESDNQFLYIEDDFLDEEGKPVLIKYPARFLDISQEDVGKRFLVLYDSDSNFQLVRLNDELSGLVPADSSFYPLVGNLGEYLCVPHLNVANMHKTGHAISGHEKQEFADLYAEIVQGVASNGMKKGIIALAVASTVVCVLLAIVEDGYPLQKTLPIAAVVLAVFTLFRFFIICLGKGNLRRQGMKFVYGKEVIFHSYVIEDNVVRVKVYEWNEGQVELCEYRAGNVASDTAYGSVLYKFTNQKGDFVLLNSSLTAF